MNGWVQEFKETVWKNWEYNIVKKKTVKIKIIISYSYRIIFNSIGHEVSTNVILHKKLKNVALFLKNAIYIFFLCISWSLKVPLNLASIFKSSGQSFFFVLQNASFRICYTGIYQTINLVLLCVWLVRRIPLVS